MAKSVRKNPSKEAQEPLDARVAHLSFEEAVRELEEIIQRMEQGESGLEESLKEYATGDQLIRRCRAILQTAEQKIQAIAGADLDAGREPESD